MIERYVFIKLADAYAYDNGRKEVCEHMKRVLPTVPGVRGLRIGSPADEHAVSAWDISIVLEFACLDDVARYCAHPERGALIDTFLQPRLVVMKAWNFQAASILSRQY